jgi:hypothetical protein
MKNPWECPDCHGQTHSSNHWSKRPRRLTTAAGPLVVRYRKCSQCGRALWTYEGLVADAHRFSAYVMGNADN